MLNCNQINKLSIYHYLLNNSIKISTAPKESDNEAWFYSPLHNEKTASFKVNKQKNTWFDFGIGKGGRTVDLIMQLHNCNVKEVIELFKDKDYFFFPKQEYVNNETISKSSPSQELIKIQTLSNQALLQYLNERNINIEIAKKYCDEIYYKNNDKNYFSIGFKNVTDGYEMRNKYFKNCWGNKNISLLENGNSSLSIFEGFSDFLSYKTLKLGESEDFLILNSISLYEKAKPYLEKYKHLKLFLDNDKAGKNLTAEILKTHSNAKDFSALYKNHKDLNDYINASSNKKIYKRRIN